MRAEAPVRLASRSSLVLVLLAGGCAQQPRWAPPEPAPPDVATFVSAGFDLTWTAALDHFAIIGVPIASVDRGSGRIVTETVAVGASDAGEFADCGSVSGGDGADASLATAVVYDVVVQDEGSSSMVLVTASWEAGDPHAPFPCQTKRVWEDEAQESIRLAAEVYR